jgi:asparagine synthase (glutamine-hydrolysing)
MNTELLKNIEDAIKKTVPKKRFAIAFSGGVDSTLLSKILSDLKYDVTLLTIGFSESHDILFAKKVNQILQFPHHILEIDGEEFEKISSDIKKTIKTDNLSWNENCIAFYYISKLAHSLEFDIVVTANGIDELFCGYNAYREVISQGESKVKELMDIKLKNEIKMMKAVNLVSSEFGVKILQPLLSTEFVTFAKSIPISEKILDSEDLVRKHAIRKLALDVGVPEISYTKRKKALQYGTKIHKKLLKIR